MRRVATVTEVLSLSFNLKGQMCQWPSQEGDRACSSSQLLSRMPADSEMPGLLISLEKLKIPTSIGMSWGFKCQNSQTHTFTVLLWPTGISSILLTLFSPVYQFLLSSRRTFSRCAFISHLLHGSSPSRWCWNNEWLHISVDSDLFLSRILDLTSEMHSH